MVESLNVQRPDERERPLSTLIVLLPPRDPAVRSEEWQLPELPFLLVDKRGETQRAGRAALGLLPRASATVLIVAARDLLLLATPLPPLKAQKLRQALPNVVEDQLIQDPQTCHIAVDPVALEGGRRVLAMIDRGWFRFVLSAFASSGHRSVKAVPAMRCLPALAAVEGEPPVPRAVHRRRARRGRIDRAGVDRRRRGAGRAA